MIRELRIPVESRPSFVAEAEAVSVFSPMEYWVVEHDDVRGLFRHPTTGNVVTEAFWIENRKAAQHFLRTGE